MKKLLLILAMALAPATAYAQITPNIRVTFGGVAQPISATSLPLPTGAATSAEQVTQTGHQADIVTATETVAATVDQTAGAVKTIWKDASGADVEFAADGVHGQAVETGGPQITVEAKDHDGAALPNAVTEGQAVRPAASLFGVQYFMPTNENGSDVATVTAQGSNSKPIVACDQVYVGSPSADTVAIPLSGSTTIKICSIHIDAEGTVDTKLISGTQTTTPCDTSTSDVSTMYAFSTVTGVLGTNEGSGLGMIMKGDPGEAVCVDVSAAVVNNIRITYTYAQ
jgi:hypothetical protein